MVSFNDLNARLSASSATWTARQTPQFLLSDEQKARLLGVIVNEADLAAALAPRAQAEAPNFAQAVDWRNRNGNHVTSVKNQAGCGSCVSFCTVATVESMASIELGQKLDLSEADLHFCSDHGPSCGGWWPTNAYNAFRDRGVADEACFPYPSDASGNVNPACATCANHDARAVKITNSTTLSSATERKNWLTNVGSCCAVIHVFDDFFAYGGGVYRHIVDNNPNTPDDIERGLHCVEIIGYSEAEQCWIGKNSWGTAWGDQGFFKIGYGEIGIDTDFPFWTARGIKVPVSKGWSGWFALGTPQDGFIGAPSVTSRNGSVCNIYVRGTDNALWQKAWFNNTWHDWARHNDGGVLASEPGLGSMGPNHEHVFVRGTDNQVWQKYWQG
jgi:C1A family cysteine protease